MPPGYSLVPPTAGQPYALAGPCVYTMCIYHVCVHPRPTASTSTGVPRSSSPSTWAAAPRPLRRAARPLPPSRSRPWPTSTRRRRPCTESLPYRHYLTCWPSCTDVCWRAADSTAQRSAHFTVYCMHCFTAGAGALRCGFTVRYFSLREVLCKRRRRGVYLNNTPYSVFTIYDSIVWLEAARASPVSSLARSPEYYTRVALRNFR